MVIRLLRETLIGPPLPTQRLSEERLSKFKALATFSPDALSSIAYANQEIFLGLVVAGQAGLVLAFPIAGAIAALLVMVGLSYGQTIRAYPGGGGSYAVARANLGDTAGLLAAAALLLGYTLASAVSLTAGIEAIASVFPTILPYRAQLALAMLALITLANLRGLRESGTLMALPVYFFLLVFIAMLAVGAVTALNVAPGVLAESAPDPKEALSLFIVLHTFASGTTALTGIESISNGVQAFKKPEIKNANTTLGVMAALMVILFAGSVGLTQYFAVVAGTGETILSALSRRILGDGLLYVIVQVATLGILLVAANTSFAGFPRVASLLAQDDFAPRQLAVLGDRLVFANGMVLLAGLTALLIVVFGGDTHALIPLFAIGALLAFTLSQAGMVVHWVRERGKGWLPKLIVNALGTLATGLALVVVSVTKFTEGAWIAFIVVPILLLSFRRVNRHYQGVHAELTMKGLPPILDPLPHPRLVMPISGVHRGVISALRYALSIADDITAVYVEIDPGQTEYVKRQWQRWGMGVKLVVVPSPYRSVVGPFLDFLDQTDQEHNDGQLASVIVPEFVLAHWWENFLHNQTAWTIRLALLYRRRKYRRIRAIIEVPMHLRS